MRVRETIPLHLQPVNTCVLQVRLPLVEASAIAQLGEHQTEDQDVPSSILGLGICVARETVYAVIIPLHLQRAILVSACSLTRIELGGGNLLEFLLRHSETIPVIPQCGAKDSSSAQAFVLRVRWFFACPSCAC